MSPPVTFLRGRLQMKQMNNLVFESLCISTFANKNPCSFVRAQPKLMLSLSLLPLFRGIWWPWNQQRDIPKSGFEPASNVIIKTAKSGKQTHLNKTARERRPERTSGHTSERATGDSPANNSFFRWRAPSEQGRARRFHLPAAADVIRVPETIYAKAFQVFSTERTPILSVEYEGGWLIICSHYIFFLHHHMIFLLIRIQKDSKLPHFFRSLFCPGIPRLSSYCHSLYSDFFLSRATRPISHCVGRSVRPSVRPFVGPSVGPTLLFLHFLAIWR